MMRFVGQHAIFGAAAAASLLTPDLFDPSSLGRHYAGVKPFDLIQKQTTGNEPVQSLLSRRLAFDLQACWAVQKHHASGALVDILAAMAARADKRLLDVSFGDTQSGHPLRKLIFFFSSDWEVAHKKSKD